MQDTTSNQHRLIAGLLRRNWRAVAASGGIVTDCLVILASFLTASSLSYPELSLADVLTSHVHLLSFSVLVFVGSFTALGLYRVISYVTLRRQYTLAVRSYFYFVGLILCTLFVYQNQFYSREFLFTFFLLVPLLYSIAWIGFRVAWKQLRRFRVGRWNTLVVASEATMERVLRHLHTLPGLGYDVVRTIRSVEGEQGMLHIDREDVERSIQEDDVEMIILSSSHLNGSFNHLEDICHRHRVRMSVLSGESDDLFSRTRIYDLCGIPVFSQRGERMKFLKGVVKRSFDIVASLILLIFFSPAFLMIAIATKLESRGPVFFKQDRALSDRDRPFKFFKFRSMIHAADEIKESLVDQNESSGALFKIKNDPRLTKVGRFIRRHSLDELPQLLNVLKGDMSLVGPRPLPVTDFVLLDERDHLGGYFRNRVDAKPGITGLWQVSGRSDLGFREMVLLDLYYIEHQTLLFDLEILLRTIPAVLFGKGAY